MLGPFWDVEALFCVAGARDSAPSQWWAECESFVAVSKTLAGVGHAKRFCQDEFIVAGAVEETCSSDVRRSER